MDKFYYSYEKIINYPDKQSLLNYIKFLKSHFSIDIIDNIEIFDINGNGYSWRDCLMERDTSYD